MNHRKAESVFTRNLLRHIDAALIYGNQNEVGQGIKNSGVAREDIFLVSKVSVRGLQSRSQHSNSG
jgi:glycerol 2-dehydrogenase (NADP+)